MVLLMVYDEAVDEHDGRRACNKERLLQLWQAVMHDVIPIHTQRTRGGAEARRATLAVVCVY